jgi:uncharacterized membrane protein
MNMLVWNHTRFWSAVLTGAFVYVVTPASWGSVIRLLSAWNASVLLLLPLLYLGLRRADGDRLRTKYEEEDPTGPLILIAVTIAALCSIVAIVALLTDLRTVSATARTLHVTLAGVTIVDSWMLVPTMFTLHYADLYYSAAEGTAPPLHFPNTPKPAFWDFVYFSFTIAAACQTADVATNDVSIRRAVIAHTLISFLFNVSIVGFAINVTAGLIGGNG